MRTHRVGRVVVELELVDQELANHGRRLPIFKPHPSNSRDKVLSHEVLGDVREVVGLGHVAVLEQVLLRVLRVVAVTEEELEEVEQAQEILSPNGTLHETNDLVPYMMCGRNERHVR